ncbi:MAG: hypothetical protein KDB21_07030 [Acidimicrobiales bacterium]|nr:hypothetical protein [Acidimicrobiales bacterium]
MALSPRGVRALVLAVCAGSILGMILSSVASRNGLAVSFGLVAAAAVGALILVTAVVGPHGFERRGTVDERRAAEIEQQIGGLVSSGADETAVRRVVRDAVELGRTAGPPRARP